jgi:CheY-like chemotaxis protein
MPIMDGCTATQEIRAFERANDRRAVRVIALTGLANMRAQQEAFTSGVNLFLTKPVRLAELSKILITNEDGYTGFEHIVRTDTL